MSAQNVLFDAPGPKARQRHAILTGVGILLAAGLLWIILSRLAEAGQLEAAKWKPFVTDSSLWVNYLIPGLIGTLKAAVLSVIFAGIFGLVFGMGRLSHIKAIRWTSGAIVEFFRSVPVLMMMIFLYFGYFATSTLVPSSQGPLAAVVLALTLYNGSVIAELVRSGVHSLPKGQSEAGLSIGLTPSQTLRSIQLPQALTAMLPALISQFVVVLKDSALGTAITYQELLTWSKTAGSAYSNTVPALIVCAAMFIAINYGLTRVATSVERRLNRRGHVAGPVLTVAPTMIQGQGEPGQVTAHGTRIIGAGIESAEEAASDFVHQARDRHHADDDKS